MIFKAKSEDTRNFIKLKDKEKIQGVFRGDPEDFRIHWADKKSSLCKGDHCGLCAQGNESKFRFRINFITPEGEGYVAKILEQGWQTYEALMQLQESGYDLEMHLMIISRIGTGLNTQYSIIPSPKGMIPANKVALINAVKLNDLSHKVQTQAAAEPAPADLPPLDADPGITDDDIPF